jgi:hypothetical protein
MGATVIIAIKHKQDRLFEDRWVSHLSSEMSYNDNMPKKFGQITADIGYTHEREVPLRASGILVSAYKDNEYEQNIFINHEFLVGMPMLNLRNGAKILDSEPLIAKHLLKEAKRGRYPFGRYMKKTKQFVDLHVPSPQINGESSISIFSLQTDSYSRTEFEDHFKNMLSFVDTGILHSQTFGRIQVNPERHSIYAIGSKIEYLATLKPNTSAIINLDRGLTRVIKMPYREIDISNCSDTLEIKNDILIPFMASIGVHFKPAPKKQNQPSSPEI